MLDSIELITFYHPLSTYFLMQSGERYCFLTNKWEEISPMKFARASPAVAAANGKIYAIGGDRISEVNFYRARYRVFINESV